VLVVTVPPKAMKRVVEVMNNFNLDFDDAYQYVAAEREKAIIISFDKDFDKTEQGRWTPIQAINHKK